MVKRMFGAAASVLLLSAVTAWAAVVPFTDGDMEAPGREAWTTYGTPVSIEKVERPHSGRWALQVKTDNKDTMGGGFEGVSRYLGELNVGDRLRVSFWLRPLAGHAVGVGMGRTSFEQMWHFFDTDWMYVVCDFRARAAGRHSIWITQHGAANEFLLDDFVVEKIPALQLGAAPEAERVTVGDDAARLWFCRKTGALCGIQNLATGETLAVLGERQPLFSLGLLSRDGLSVEEVGFDQAQLESCQTENGGRRLTLAFTLRPAPIRVTCRVERVARGEFAFTADVDNPSDRTILDFSYPKVLSVNPATDPKSLTLVHPYICGQIAPEALKSAGCDAVYPGRAVMGWFDLYGERGGIGLASHDRTRTGTRLTALPSAKETFDLGLTKEVRIAPKSAWKAPEHVLLVHAGDWHAAADRYREWARAWLGAPNVPQWIRDSDGWVLMGIQNGIPFWRIPHVYRSAEWMGLDYLHVQGEGVDNMWFDAEGKRQGHAMTFPFPSPKFGTVAELKQAIQETHDRNGHVMFYFVYERWTPSLSTAEDLGSAPRSAIPKEFPIPGLDFYETNALIERPGGRLPKEHPHMAERLMCLGAPGWQEWMRWWAVDVYAKQFGADGFYWDVMGRNGPFRCFNERHGHRGENLWAAGSAAVLERTLREGRQVNPNYSCAIEGTQDALSPWVGFHLMSGATKTPEVFRYTFPELCLVDGFSNHYWKWTQPEKARRVFLVGERFDIHGYHQEVRKLIWLRKRLKPFIDWPARFMDTVGVWASDPAVQVKRFVRDDGQNRAVLVTMLNEEGRKDAWVSVQLSPLQRFAVADLFLPDGSVRPLDVALDKIGMVSFRAPSDAVSAALLVESVEPALAVVPTIEQIMTPGVDGLELTLFFPGGQPVKADVTLRAPAGVSLQEIPSPRANESPAVLRRAWKPEGGLQALRGWEKVYADVQWQGGKATVWCLLCPPLANGNFETFRPDGRLEYWPAIACTESPAEGKHCLRLVNPDGKGHGHVSLLTPLKPSTRYRFSAKIKRDAPKSDARASVIEYEEGLKFKISASVGSGGKADEWEAFTTEFTSHPNPRTSAVYLYLGSSQTAWFDDLRLEEIAQ
ncbi:MAG: hypothetical protein FJ272_03090 [Planctomycetes bacterium]|nr:hypothetical protein [Planctomycetota bacterium]